MPYGMSDVEYAKEVDRKRAAGIKLTQPLDEAAYARGKAQLAAQASTAASKPATSGGMFTVTDPYGKTYTIPSLTPEQVSAAKTYLQSGGDPTKLFAGPGQLSEQAYTTATRTMAQQPQTQQQVQQPQVQQQMELPPEIRNLINQAVNMLASPPQPTIPPEIQQELNWLRQQYQQLTSVPRLSWEEARARAEAALNPLYRTHLQQALKEAEQDLIKRGFFGQLPSVPIAQDVVANVENARAAAIADLANQLVGQSEQAASDWTRYAVDLQKQAMDLLTNALREAREYQQQQFTNRIDLAKVLEAIREWEQEFPLKESEVTGTYMGVPTLPASMKVLTDVLLPLVEKMGFTPTLMEDWQKIWPYLPS